MCLGIPGKVVEIVDPSQQRVVADVDGARREISVALLGIAGEEQATIGRADASEAVGLGDWVLIHVGFAMSKIDEAEANETLRALKALGDAYDQEFDEFSRDGPMDPLEMLADELPDDLGDPTRLPADAPPTAHDDPTRLPPADGPDAGAAARPPSGPEGAR